MNLVLFCAVQVDGSKFVEALQGQHNILEECIERLRAAESSRATLVSHLKEALREQVSLSLFFFLLCVCLIDLYINTMLFGLYRTDCIL